MKKFKQEMETNDFIQAAVKCFHWFIAEMKAYDWSRELLTGTVSHFILGLMTKKTFLFSCWNSFPYLFLFLIQKQD